MEKIDGSKGKGLSRKWGPKLLGILAGLSSESRRRAAKDLWKHPHKTLPKSNLDAAPLQRLREEARQILIG